MAAQVNFITFCWHLLLPGLNISTEHRKISGKKSSYVRRKTQLDTVARREIEKFQLATSKIQKYLVSIGHSCSGFSFHEHFKVAHVVNIKLAFTD